MNTGLQYNNVAYKFVPKYLNAYVHTMLNAPVFVQSPKISNIGPD